ncbi:hypothetical protein GIB67_002081 [Kingdonia uniflora]|uniref:Uncharacterized protein n=1 Tax=Kingdonia uniflora TaxID=39325 RepID=A0A7J7KWE2_9MAGN|nr:hypothetical protein GIB67_002081 [Kingdonia uniflora]
MANPEESSPLLTNQSLPNENPNSQFEMPESPKKPAIDESFGKNFVSNEGWTADGLPLGHGSVVGEPVGRVQWNSSILACLGRNDEFCSSDVEV